MTLTDAEYLALQARRALVREARKLAHRQRYERRMRKIYPRWGQGTNCHGLI